MEAPVVTPALTPVRTQDQMFTDFVNAHIHELYNYARYMVLDRDDADDIVQKTFISLHENLAKLDLEKPIKPWLFRVAKNHCLDYHRRKRAVQFSELEDDGASIPEHNQPLEDQLHDTMFLEQVRTHITSLPLPAREILLLKYFEDFTFEQIAEILELPVGTVKAQFYRGKVKLFRLLDSHYR